MSDFDFGESLRSPGEGSNIREALWQTAVGNMRASAVFYDEEMAIVALRVSEKPPALGIFMLEILKESVDEDTDTDEADYDSVDIEFFRLDEVIPSREGVFHVLMDRADVDMLLAFLPDEALNTPLQPR